jgi:hypothetical protein
MRQDTSRRLLGSQNSIFGHQVAFNDLTLGGTQCAVVDLVAGYPIEIALPLRRYISLLTWIICACFLSSFLDRLPDPPSRQPRFASLLHDNQRSFRSAQPRPFRAIYSWAPRGAHFFANRFNCDVVADPEHPILAFILASNASDSSPPHQL